jgi:hypothetical protein
MISTNGTSFPSVVELYPVLTRTRRFLGPRMIYTSGVVLDINKTETLEELQDNKLAIVCNKLNLKPTDKYVSYCMR